MTETVTEPLHGRQASWAATSGSRVSSGLFCLSMPQPPLVGEQREQHRRRCAAAPRRRARRATPAADASSVRRARRVGQPVQRRSARRTRAPSGALPPRTASARPRRAPVTRRRAARSAAPGRRPRSRAGRCPCGTACTCRCPARGTRRSARARTSGSAGTHRPVDVERVADAERRRVDQADDVAGVGVVDGLPLPAEHLLGVFRRERPAGLRVGHHHAALEDARADPHEREPVAVGGVHAGLHLEHEGAERRGDRRGSPVDVGARRAARARARRACRAAGGRRS